MIKKVALLKGLKYLYLLVLEKRRHSGRKNMFFFLNSQMNRAKPTALVIANIACGTAL